MLRVSMSSVVFDRSPAVVDSDDEGLRFLRILSGQLSGADLAEFRRHFGQVRLPKRTPAAVGRFLRDHYLRNAFQLSGATSVPQFTDAWEVFVSRGAYRSWRDEESPPNGTPALETALFYATKQNRGQTLCEKRVATVLGTNLRRSFRPDSRP